MNTKFLFSQISQDLQTNIFSFDPDRHYLSEESHPFMEKFIDIPNPNLKKIMDFLLDLTHGDIPLLSTFDHKIIYACCAGPERFYLIGPVKLSLALTIRHNMPLPENAPAENLKCPACTLTALIKSVLWVQNLCCGYEVSENTILTHNCISREELGALTNSSSLEFSNRENQKRHNSYYQEFRMLSSIEQGNLYMLEQCNIESPAPQELGTLSKDYGRNFKNISISVITLISRAAIRGGLHPETAFSLCDSYIMQIEELKEITALQPLVESAKIQFALLVHALKEKKKSEEKEKHPLVERAKDLVYSQLHGKITLKEIACELNVNPNYLSNLFRQHDGIAFSDYVLNAKIELTKNLLTYSQYTYLEIASYLGFSSQSHLGKQFKAATGMTLQQFRNKYSSFTF